MTSITYVERRSQIENYFDRTAAETWSRLTSDAPVNHIRATVRAGRDLMRATLLDRLPADLTGYRLLDAGCGTGALAVEAARRGADVVAVDLSPTLIGLARSRSASVSGAGRITFSAGDMLAPALGDFDYVVAMDSLIHYVIEDVVTAICGLAPRTRRAMLFTFAPRTPALAGMHCIGRLFPRANRAPAIQPIAERKMIRLLVEEWRLAQWQVLPVRRVKNGFYISQALELRRQ
jgi:magnesium-protoporphyrin O-methyltransferase